MPVLSIQAPLTIKTTVSLSASKSISNRVLIINALSDSVYPIENISDSDDTKVLFKALESPSAHFDIGAAGTSMRFLTAYLSQKEGQWFITGTERMKHRPIGVLVDALRSLGAHIEYAEKEGFPPLQIYGKPLYGGALALNGGVSSQYISALMMIAPCMKKGMELTLEGNIISQPYIEMTISLMKCFGVNAEWRDNLIRITPQKYRAVPFQVESDWSAASYWYEIVALSPPDTEILLTGLQSQSTQGDSKGRNLFSQLGVETTFSEEGIILKKGTIEVTKLAYDFINEPDLAQTFVVTCCMMNIPFRFTGLQSLRIKETDRITALQQEMKKLGYILRDESDNTLIWDGITCDPDSDPIISTYEDHRMAMAFAPVCLKKNKIKIQNPSVVSKSYPGYWNDLRLAGFNMEEI
ncbi:3-phosphoshikimate 1-carboxyvinyltransferase [Bacteroidales bacterium OttesenSCG-928-M06]|nr:3-phosphoshikimate 1-carboxyvinyltransferase [Bacteroidales bacterium OttesenSCG-928-M06]